MSIFARKIASAPRDGTRIMVFDGLWFIVRWQDGRFIDHHGSPVDWATHWKNYPAAPLGHTTYQPDSGRE